jgi:peptide/nickel transport system substrate-binding protein
MAAMTAAMGAVTACGAPPTNQQAQGQPTAPPAAQPTTAAGGATAAPAATAAPITVSSAAPTAAPPATGSGKYKEAPQLADLVKQGKLPVVDQRLPSNPRALKPLEQTGQYGGTWHRAYKGLSDRWGPTKLNEEFLIKWDVPDPNTIKVIASFTEKWEQNADATEFTFYFRKGSRWSDGAEVTTDDTKFWLEDIQQNKELTPVPSFLIRQKVGADYKMADVTIVDKYTVKIKYPAPNPLLPISIAKNGGGFPAFPALIAPTQLDFIPFTRRRRACR